MMVHFHRFRLWFDGWLVLLLVISVCRPAGAVTPTATARYTVTFNSTWSAATHPQGFPTNPHFSSLIGGTHNANIVFWDLGILATPGIQDVAELGSPGQLQNEVNTAIMAGTALNVISGSGIRVSPGFVSTAFDINQSHPLVTLVTMLAPSPDWFIGVHGLNLFQNGRWAERVVEPVFVYDAGTDSGATYNSPDAVTVPPQPIFRLNGPPFLVNGVVPPLGTLTFQRTDLRCDIDMSQLSYVDGDTITVDRWRLANLNSEPTSLEVGIWLDVPEDEPIGVVDDVVELMPETTEEQGPLSVLPVTPDLPRGTYTVGCRALDPVTKLLRYEKLVAFEVQ